MYSKQCKKPQVQKNSPSTLFRVLTALKRVKTDFKLIVPSFLVSLFTFIFLYFFVSWFLCLFGSLVLCPYLRIFLLLEEEFEFSFSPTKISRFKIFFNHSRGVRLSVKLFW